MKKLVERNEFAAYGVLALVFLILGITLNPDAVSALNLLLLPFNLIGNALRAVGNPFAFVPYILVCLSPLVFPVVRILKERKVRPRYLTWVIMSAFSFAAVYFFINPHKAGLFSDVLLLGYAVTMYAFLILGLLQEFNGRQKKNGKKVFYYAKILFMVLIAAVLFEVFFSSVSLVKLAFQKLSVNLPEAGSFDYFLNAAAIIFVFLIWLLPAFYHFKLLLQAKSFVSNMQINMFEPQNLPKLGGIIKSCNKTIFFTIAVSIVNNLVILTLANRLVDMTFNIELPIQLILTACLITIFSKILMKAIEVNEENRLTI